MRGSEVQIPSAAPVKSRRPEISSGRFLFLLQFLLQTRPNRLAVGDAVEVFRDRYGSRNNVGVLTGPISGILVIDVDPRSGGLRDKLIAELPGILAWAVRGGLLWQKEGLIPPAAVSRLSGGDGCFGCFP